MTRTIILCLTTVSLAGAQRDQPADTALPALPSDIVQPVLPQETVPIVYPTVTGDSTAVHAEDDLQVALNGAGCGDEIVLDAGATYSGSFSIPAKNCTGWILVRSVSISSLPPGVRVQQSQAALMPTVMTTNTQSALGFEPGASNWYFAGINFTVKQGVQGLWNLISLDDNATTVAQLPHNIIFDRVLVHGNDQYCVRGFLANAVAFALVNSQVYDFNHIGQDTQAVVAYNTPGPFLIYNNYLEATGENIMFGGAGTSIPGVIPSDAIVRRNHLAKLPAWYHGPAPCGGSGQRQCYDLKNSFEVKNGQRILLDSNIMSYAPAQGQGECIILNTPLRATGGLTAADITITNNRCEHAGAFAVMAGNSAAKSARVLVRNNLATDIGPPWGPRGTCMQVSGPNINWTVDHNTCINQSATSPTFAIFFGDGPPSGNTNFTATNNIMGGPIAANRDNPSMALASFTTGCNLSYDVFVGDTWPNGCAGCNPAGPAYPTANHFWSVTSTAMPAGNKVPCNYPAGATAACIPINWSLVGFVDFAGGNYALAPASHYHNAGSDGADVGARISAVLAATAGVAQQGPTRGITVKLR